MSSRGALESLIFVLLVLTVLAPTRISAIGEVIWAVNSGGGQHVDIHGVHYQKVGALTTQPLSHSCLTPDHDSHESDDAWDMISYESWTPGIS